MLLIVTDIVDFIVLKDAFIVVEFTYNAWLLSSENYTKLKIHFPRKFAMNVHIWFPVVIFLKTNGHLETAVY